MEEMELFCFNIISAAGMAKSSYVEAMREAAEGNFDAAADKIKEGDGYYANGHNVHADLIAKESNGEAVPPCLLLIHAEDQMMSAETIRLMAEENIKLYKKLSMAEN